MEPKRTNIRWQIRRDMECVLEIEQLSFGPFAWTEEEFIRQLRNRNTIGMVAERDDQVVGYMIYELHRNRLHLLNFAVHPNWRRDGVGKAMIDKLKYKLTPDRRNRIMLEVRETNLNAQMFFRAMGFKAISVLRDFFEDVQEDAYLFQYRHVVTGDDGGSQLSVFRSEG
jgi:[ribosomal protein S18]-alanine N-acetyltransferase